MRKSILLMKEWSFTRLSKSILIPEEANEYNTEMVSLPHVWNKEKPEELGCCLYTKHFTVNKNSEKNYFIAFDALGGVARVFLNGGFLGEHRGGYSRFCYSMNEFIKDGDNCLQVIADNTRYEDVNPLIGDFSYFGGIYRDVNLIETEYVYIDPTYYGTSGIDINAKADGTIQIAVNVAADNKVDLVCKILNQDDVWVAGKEQKANLNQLELKVENPILWQGKENPYMYRCIAELRIENEIYDSVELPFGFRNIEMKPESGFYLNGEHIKLHGVAKHQDFEGKACGTGAAEQRKDMELIEEIGANAVRLSHYQHPAYTYDLCDKMGFIVWAEIPMLAMPDGNEAIVENAKEQLKELILQNKHHPSICFWGVQNEIAMRGESQFTYNHVEKLNRIVKSLDPTRLSAGANLYSVKNDSPLNFINDAVGYNIYFGWYYGKLTDYEDFLNKFHEENPNVSLGISEYGVDCNTKFHSEEPECKDYSEEFQCVYHEAAYGAFEKDTKLWGSFVWNMFDFSSAIRDEGGVKARNCKGLVTYDREVRKDSFYYYKASWSDDKFVHINGRRFVNRCGDTTTITVYSNEEQVELYLNGEFFSRKSGKRKFEFTEVPIDKETKVTAKAGDCVDETSICKVDSPDKSYTYEKKGQGAMVTNWFLTDAGQKNLFPEDYYSFNDKMGDLFANPQVTALLEEEITEIAHDERARSFGGMPLLRVLDYNSGLYTEEKLKKLNEKLNQIKKEK